jgi:hypothetical protein
MAQDGTNYGIILFLNTYNKRLIQKGHLLDVES